MLPFVLSPFDENQPLQMVQRMAILLNAASTVDDDIKLHFMNDDYISPAVAPFFLAARDMLTRKNHLVIFDGKDFSGKQSFSQFFFDSGLYYSTSGLLREHLDKANKQYHLRSNQAFQASAHAIDLTKMREANSMRDLVIEARATVAAMPHDIPVIYSNSLIAQVFELLSNSYIHSKSDQVYTMCVNTKHNNTVTIVYDTGIGIPAAYDEFRKQVSLPALSDEDAIRWAMVLGHSTKQYIDPNPRGVGYQALHDFAKQHQGSMIVASGHGVYQYNEHNTGRIKLSSTPISLPGTFYMLRVPYV